MTTKQAIRIIEDHNNWRRGGSGIMMDPKELGIALDKALTVMRNYLIIKSMYKAYKGKKL